MTGRGPHPAASPFDKRISEPLGLRAFEIYQVELPAGGETVMHDHLEDGRGCVCVHRRQRLGDRRRPGVPVCPGDFVAVTVESTRQVRAGHDGLVLIAVCSSTS